MADIEFTIERSGYLPIHLNSDGGGSYGLQSNTLGFGVPTVVSKFTRGVGDGGQYLGERVDLRTLDVAIQVSGTDRMSVGSLVRDLANLVRARRNQPLPKLVASYATGEVFEMPFVYQSGLEGDYSELHGNTLRLVLSLVCPKPFWTSQDAVAVQFEHDPAVVGLLPDLAALKVMSSTNSGEIEVENPGDVDSDVVWRITGPGGPTSVSINGEGFIFEDVLEVGEIVTVDGESRSVTDQDGVNRYSGLASAPRFARIPSGRSTVDVSMDGASAGLWVDQEVLATNSVANASMEASSGSSALRTNLVTNPSMEAVASGAVVMRRNLITNPSFEVNTTGWSVVGTGTITRSTEQAYLGSASAKAVTSTASHGIATTDWTSITAGGTYTISVWVKGEAGKTFQAQLFEGNNGSLVGDSASSLTTMTGGWQRVSITRSFTGNQYQLVCRNQTAGAHTFYVDAVMLEASSTVGDYFDGSTPDALGWDYAWSGTANASISTAACAATTVRTNLITNPSFEVDASGWLQAASATVSRVTTQAYIGTASLQVATTSAVGDGAYWLSSGSILTSGTTYTASVWVKGPAGHVVYGVFRPGTGGDVNSADTTLTGSWQRISMTHASASGTAQIMVRQRTATAVTFYVDAMLVEASSTVGDYFDGSFQPAGDFSYGWTGTANASTSIQRGAAVAGIGTNGTQARGEKYVGSASAACFAQAYNNTLFFSDIPATASTTYTASIYVKGEVGKKLLLEFGEVNSGGAVIDNTYSAELTCDGTWQRLSATNTFGATGVKARMIVYNRTSGPHTFYVDAGMLEASPIAGTYFDGTTASTDSDFSIAWNGYAHASTSSVYADAISGINGMTPVNAVSNRSSQWFKVGTKSYRIIPTQLANESYGYTPSYTITAGQQYTATGVIRIPEPLLGTLHTDALKLRVNINNGSTYVKTEAAPNSAGEYTLTVTFTAPVGATNARLELMNGASAGNGNVWWDTIGLINKPDTPFFDGNSTTLRENGYAWTGTANDSTSVWNRREIEGRSSISGYYKPRREVIF